MRIDSRIRPTIDSRRVRRDREQRNAVFIGLAARCSRRDDEQFGTATIQDTRLLAAQGKSLAVLFGSSLDIGDVESPLRFGESQRRLQFALDQWRERLGFLVAVRRAP
jgi:hypothetical protein